MPISKVLEKGLAAWFVKSLASNYLRSVVFHFKNLLIHLRRTRDNGFTMRIRVALYGAALVIGETKSRAIPHSIVHKAYFMVATNNIPYGKERSKSGAGNTVLNGALEGLERRTAFLPSICFSFQTRDRTISLSLMFCSKNLAILWTQQSRL